jgi:hypothetical protein
MAAIGANRFPLSLGRLDTPQNSHNDNEHKTSTSHCPPCVDTSQPNGFQKSVALCI